ncbi:MAG: DUF4157 domain-containing protein [Limnohabitans sp.]|nr:DUF4157 domain-containing protein [Limnohabitans sp.]
MSAFSKKNIGKPTNTNFSNEKSSEDFFGVQAKLNIGKSNDKYEVEADRVADQVVSNKNNSTQDTFFNPQPVVQKKKANDEQKENNTEKGIQEKSVAENSTPVVQQKSSKEEINHNKKGINSIPEKGFLSKPILQSKPEEEVQAKKEDESQTKDDEKKLQTSASSDANPSDNSNLENNLNRSKGGGSPLSESTKTEMESGFGTDFSNVKVHTDSNAVQMNKELGSQAFANGSDIYFNEGKYNPQSTDGKHLLAHELTHTVQQGASKPNIQKQEEETTSSPETETNNSTLETTTNNETSDVENDTTNTSSQPEDQNSDTGDLGNNSDSTIVNQTNIDTNNSSNQSNTQNTNSSTSESDAQNTSEAEENTETNQSTIPEMISEDNQSTASDTSIIGTSATDTTSTNTVNTEGGGGFETYQQFLAYVDEKKQASTEYFKNKKKELTDGINEEKRKNKETITNEITRLKETKRVALEKINTSYDLSKNAITLKRDTEIQNAKDLAISELLRVDEVIVTKTELITKVAEDKAQSVITTGNDQSTEALKVTSQNIKNVDSIILQKQSQYSGRDNVNDIIEAAWESKPETVSKIQESGDIISSEIISHSEKLAQNYRDDASNIASNFGDKKQEAIDAITQKRDETITAVTDSAKEALTTLDQETTNLKTELETNVNSQILILENLPSKSDSELDDVLRIVLEKVNQSESTTIQEIDQFKNDIGEIYWYNEEVAEAQTDLGKAIDEHHKDVDVYIKDVIKKVTDISTQFKDDFVATQNTINSALAETANGYDTSVTKLKTDTVKTIDDAAKESSTQTKTVADSLDAGLQEKIDESETKWNSQLTTDIANMRETVSNGLLQQTEILSQFTSNLDEEFNRDRSWWDDVTDFISGMARGFVEGFTSLLSALWDAMGTLIFWIIVLVVVLVILFLVFVVGVAFAVILKVLLVIGIVVGVLAAIYFIYKAITTEGLSPYERGKLFGRALFEIAFALIGTGVYARLMGWIPRIGRIAEIVARVGSWSRFIRIVIRVKNVRAFVALIDSIANLEKLLQVMDKIQDVEALIKLLSSADDVERIINVLLAVEKADDLLKILVNASDIGKILTIVERGIQIGKVENLIGILTKTRELAKLILVLERSGDDFARVVDLLAGAQANLDKMIIAMERVGTANLGRLIGLLEVANDTAALLRITTTATDFTTMLRIVEEATDVNKIVALFDKVTELDDLVKAFDAFADTDRLLLLFEGVTDANKLVTVLRSSTKLDKLVPFLEGLADINAALPKLEALGTELDDFVKLLDEAGMTIPKLEKILFYQNLTVAKFKDLLTKAGGLVDDLIIVLDEIKDLDKLLSYINHFGDFAKVKRIVDRAIAAGLSRASSGSTFIFDFMEACLRNNFTKVDKIIQFFDKVSSSSTAGMAKWYDGLKYGEYLASECLGAANLNVPARSIAGTGQVGQKVFTIADGTTLTVTIENADIAHIASGHTWKHFFVNSFAAIESRVSMFDRGTTITDLENLARSILNSTDLENLILTLNRGDVQKGTIVAGHQVWVSLDSVRGVLSFYTQGSIGIQIEGKIMKGAVSLWQSL